jgi:hypothetical protein
VTGNPNVCLANIGGSEGWCGDGGPATSAKLHGPEAVAALPGGGFLIADSGNDVIREVSAGGTISTVAGVGFAGAAHAHGLATKAQLDDPTGVTPLPRGGYVVADTGNHLVREVHPNGHISTIAGTGADASTGDGGPAARASLRAPQGLAVMPDGSILVADPVANRVRRITPSGRIETFAGNGQPGFSGDGGPAMSAQLDYPTGVTTEPNGDVLIADNANYRVRMVAPDGTISTVAGGAGGASGGGTTGGSTASATQLQLNGPTDVAATPDGGFVIADGPVVERVAPDSSTSVIAGTGKPIYTADSGPATSTGLADATALTVAADGSTLIADDNTDRIRLLDTPGNLSTVAGSGTEQLLVSVGSTSCPNPDPHGAWYELALVPFLANLSSPAGHRIGIIVTTSLPASLTVTVTRRGRVIARSRGTFRVGQHLVRLGRAPAPGSYVAQVNGVTRLNGAMLRNCAQALLNVIHHS